MSKSTFEFEKNLKYKSGQNANKWRSQKDFLAQIVDKELQQQQQCL